MQPWYWRSLPLEHRTGSDIFTALFREEAIATLLESPYPISSDQPQLAQYSICTGAPRTVNGTLQIKTPPIGKVLPFLNQLLAQTASQQFFEIQQDYPNHLPFTGGWLGWLG
jgi:para-aminobenzoate synthetase component I